MRDLDDAGISIRGTAQGMAREYYAAGIPA